LNSSMSDSNSQVSQGFKLLSLSELPGVNRAWLSFLDKFRFWIWDTPIYARYISRAESRLHSLQLIDGHNRKLCSLLSVVHFQ
jgi:hypothetical protein